MGKCIRASTKNRFKTEYFTRKREREKGLTYTTCNFLQKLKKLVMWFNTNNTASFHFNVNLIQFKSIWRGPLPQICQLFLFICDCEELGSCHKFMRHWVCSVNLIEQKSIHFDYLYHRSSIVTGYSLFFAGTGVTEKYYRPPWYRIGPLHPRRLRHPVGGSRRLRTESNGPQGPGHCDS